MYHKVYEPLKGKRNQMNRKKKRKNPRRYAEIQKTMCKRHKWQITGPSQSTSSYHGYVLRYRIQRSVQSQNNISIYRGVRGKKHRIPALLMRFPSHIKQQENHAKYSSTRKKKERAEEKKKRTSLQIHRWPESTKFQTCRSSWSPHIVIVVIIELDIITKRRMSVIVVSRPVWVVTAVHIACGMGPVLAMRVITIVIHLSIVIRSVTILLFLWCVR